MVPVIVPLQLSVVVGAVAVAEHSPVTSVSVGTTGASVSLTVTSKNVVDVPQLFSAVTVTFVVPMGNVCGIVIGLPSTEKLSVPLVVTLLPSVIVAPHTPAVFDTTVSVATAVGDGSITTTTLYVVGLTQPFADKLYTYVTLIGSGVRLNRVSFGSSEPVAGALLIPATTALLQLKVAPGVSLVGMYWNGLPSHTAGGVKVLDKAGEGFTTTTILNVVGLVQPFAVNVYV